VQHVCIGFFYFYFFFGTSHQVRRYVRSSEHSRTSRFPRSQARRQLQRPWEGGEGNTAKSAVDQLARAIAVCESALLWPNSLLQIKDCSLIDLKFFIMV
jgi:hypothetical protein